jgi:hypothetical protein
MIRQASRTPPRKLVAYLSHRVAIPRHSLSRPNPRSTVLRSLVDPGVERRWSAAVCSPRLAPGDLIAAFRDRVRDPAGPQHRAGTWDGSTPCPPATETLGVTGVMGLQQRQQVRVVPSLTRRQQHRQRTAEPIGQRMDLRAQPATGATQRTIGRLVHQSVVTPTRPPACAPCNPPAAC